MDYETQEEYVLFGEPYLIGANVAKVTIDEKVGNVIRKKSEVLRSLLSRTTYDDAADLLQKKMDENRVHAWMHQTAWSSSPGEYMEAEEGSVIHFGKMSPEKGKRKQPISWLVLKRSGSKALLITEKGIKSSNFMDDESEEWEWEYSEIRSWLNTEFYKKSFSREEKQKIQTCMTECGDILGRINEGTMVYDKVFLLSDAEANLFFSSDAARKISGTPNDVPFILGNHNNTGGDWWWLRSPGDERELVCCVDPDGQIDRHGAWVHSTVCAVRPAILIDLSCSDPRSIKDYFVQDSFPDIYSEEEISF